MLQEDLTPIIKNYKKLFCKRLYFLEKNAYVIAQGMKGKEEKTNFYHITETILFDDDLSRFDDIVLYLRNYPIPNIDEEENREALDYILDRMYEETVLSGMKFSIAKERIDVVMRYFQLCNHKKPTKAYITNLKYHRIHSNLFLHLLSRQPLTEEERDYYQELKEKGKSKVIKMD